MKDKRLEQAIEALIPFAKYAKYVESNVFLKFIPDDTRISGRSMAPTIGDCKRALKIVGDVDITSEGPQLPDYHKNDNVI